MQEYTIHSLAELKTVAQDILQQIKAPWTIGFIGELGAGKTTLVAEICKQLDPQIKIASPTYTLMQEYEFENLTIEHWDLYRVNSLPEELLEAPESHVIRMIEWADKFEELKSEFLVKLEIQTDTGRLIVLNNLL